MQETSTPIAQTPEVDEISLLDLFLLVAENIKLLIVGPVVAGVFALGIAFALPKTYESTSWLSLGESAATHLISADVLLPVLKKSPELAASHETTQGALLALEKQVRPSFNKKDGVLRLTTTGNSPEAAKKLNDLVIEQFRYFSLPKGRSLAGR